MKKILYVLTSFLLVCLGSSQVFATGPGYNLSVTLSSPIEGTVQGYVYRTVAGGSQIPETGASVTIVCNGTTVGSTSNSSGFYSINFGAAICPFGSTINGVAVHNAMFVANSKLNDGSEFNFTFPYIPPSVTPTLPTTTPAPTSTPAPTTTPAPTATIAPTGILQSVTTTPSPTFIPPVEVPEFGSIGAIIAGLSSAGALFALRRRK